MDRADAEIEEEDGDMEKSNWSAAVLRRSWWIGKRVAIAGAAITSAPVIMPSLFLLSTLGLAFSFPFGIYMAGYMCADKFMRVLLPLPPLKEEIDRESLESEDLIESGCDGDKGDEMFIDEKKREKREILEDEVEEGSLLEVGNRNEVEGPELESVESEVKDVKAGDGIGVELRNDKATVEGLRKSDANSAEEVRVKLGEEVVEDGTAALESSGSLKSPCTVVVISAKEENNKKDYEPPILKSEHLSIVELRGEGKANDTLVMKELKEDGGEEEKRLVFSEERKTDIPALKSDYVLSAVIFPSKDENAKNLEKVGSMEHRSLGKPVPVDVVDVGVTDLHSHDEISSLQRTRNEKQLWDQVFSVRAIVGHKATLQPSLGEELMVLYQMIGVEPPFSLKDATDIVEISNGLQLLKSVVGVK